MPTIYNDPVGRIEGHMGVELDTTAGNVSDARVSGTMYRGFENIFYNRPVQDCINIMQRI
jgi:hydrogenase large subunit